MKERCDNVLRQGHSCLPGQYQKTHAQPTTSLEPLGGNMKSSQGGEGRRDRFLGRTLRV